MQSTVVPYSCNVNNCAIELWTVVHCNVMESIHVHCNVVWSTVVPYSCAVNSCAAELSRGQLFTAILCNIYMCNAMLCGLELCLTAVR